MDRMSYEGGQSPAVSSGTVLDRCPRCNGELDTGYRCCVACGWSRYTSSGNVGAYVGAPPISPLPARGAIEKALGHLSSAAGWDEYVQQVEQSARAELAAMRAENARLKADIETLINPDPSIGRDTLRLVPIDRLREVYEQIIGEWGNAPQWLGNILSAERNPSEVTNDARDVEEGE